MSFRTCPNCGLDGLLMKIDDEKRAEYMHCCLCEKDFEKAPRRISVSPKPGRPRRMRYLHEKSILSSSSNG